MSLADGVGYGWWWWWNNEYQCRAWQRVVPRLNIERFFLDSREVNTAYRIKTYCNSATAEKGHYFGSVVYKENEDTGRVGCLVKNPSDWGPNAGP